MPVVYALAAIFVGWLLVCIVCEVDYQSHVRSQERRLTNVERVGDRWRATLKEPDRLPERIEGVGDSKREALDDLKRQAKDVGDRTGVWLS